MIHHDDPALLAQTRIVDALPRIIADAESRATDRQRFGALLILGTSQINRAAGLVLAKIPKLPEADQGDDIASHAIDQLQTGAWAVHAQLAGMDFTR